MRMPLKSAQKAFLKSTLKKLPEKRQEQFNERIRDGKPKRVTQNLGESFILKKEHLGQNGDKN